MRNVSVVFWYSVTICALFVLIGAVAPNQLETWSSTATTFISDKFGWYYLILFVLIFFFCVFITFSRFGKIRLGKEGERPEFNLPTWFAMLFSAGMGMGMVFWTTSEPISHAFKQSPNAPLGSDMAIKESMQYSFFHWGVSAWAVYGIVALVLAYFKFHKGYPGLVSATLTPIFGERAMQGLPGKLIDTLAIVATVFGVAATLGFGSAQINEGLSFVFNTPATFTVQLLVLFISTVLFIISAYSGVHKGIKYLSNINMGLGFVLLIMLFIAGPTLYILNMFTNTLGNYITNFFDMSFRIAPLNEENRSWINSWTIFYWAWWISWSPFVGIFIARISRGRTLREFMLGVLLVPSIICFIFFAVFGVSAINLEQNGIAQISQYALETATFGMLEYYPLGTIMSFITIIVIAIFFITSADSATFVLGMLSSSGSIEPSSFVKIVWGIMLSSMAGIIVYFGGTQGLQNLLIISALPFSVVVLLMCGSFYKAASRELAQTKKPHSKKRSANAREKVSST
ncbi:glycine/betaine ABC transporter permease [Pontibacillus halophilus JSM 076056 = DSM 19796]|uniref:Glycine/betaine ABC transporter permease n=1 Tax=Pontibacillus halophilus JSM 076056 = DSM 19796 TaxID=1385510 RepID=A0A0A5GDQ0_9BACI|nr:BCCT family transporter [Pontibacillus halophilus]KGX91341.1 glycine/betaine ABC transporter permease [Pontibacillus halophilus JSM 076056 = DSM 19796]